MTRMRISLTHAMRCSIALKFIFLWAAALVVAKLGPPGGPQKLHQDPTDSFKVMEKFQHVVAISDSDNDTVFECLAANRTEIDIEAQTATYMFDFLSSGLHIPFRISRGDTPGTVSFTIGADATPMEGMVHFTDLANCVVVSAEYYTIDQCILWTRKEVKDNVPQDCIDHFVDTCGVVVPKHSRDLCPDGEGDY
ncbi:uncharacterized protein LOC119397865 [Rhipicephalus sanguineus]|uniref:uncharacterized protein LOC119397865 n=1 Tax=Rhipicephalus sanguineus TaxID=34632 RepID=UPI001894AA04|nr:uncharacterized protein LOC119397865 [Rhipicephalus sanguineus]